MQKFKLFSALLLTILPLSSAANELLNQSDTTQRLGEVTVTAIKQSADLRLEPIASTIITPIQIDRFNITSMKGVSELAPNFYIPDYGSRMTSTIYVRGLGARIDQSAVGLTVDNVPFLNKDAYDFDLTDIERIEVLRGAQSALYGRNTMAGQINIYTLSPLHFQGFRAAATIGRGPEAKLALSAYKLLHPTLGMALSANFLYSDGFYKNTYNSKKVGTDKSLNLRWKTEWKPSERLILNNTAAFSLSRQGGYPYQLADEPHISYDDTCYYRRNAVSDGLTIKYNAPGFTLSSITSFQYVDDEMTLDQDFTPENVFNLTQKRHEIALTQDLVIRGKKQNYSWLGGLFGFYKHTRSDAPVTIHDQGIAKLITDRINNNPAIPISLEWNDPQILLGDIFRAPVWGLAAYHQSSLALGDFNFTAGIRLDYEHSALRYHSFTNTSYTIVMPGGRVRVPNEISIDNAARLTQHFLELLPKFTVAYSLPTPGKSDLYLSVGKGYKSGGFNTQMFSDVIQQEMMQQMMESMPGSAISAPYSVSDIISYKPEKSWNFEIGTHVACADGRVNCDLALFLIDCHYQQLTMFPQGTTTGRITTNAPRSRMWGAEAQIRFAPISRLSFNLNYGYTNARFTDFTVNETNYANNILPYAPAHTLFASSTYRQPLPFAVHTLEFTLSGRGVGRIYWNEENSLSQPFYAQLSASVTAKTKWADIELWGENLTATKFDVFYFKSMGNNFLQRGKPLRYGLTLRFNFGS